VLGRLPELRVETHLTASDLRFPAENGVIPALDVESVDELQRLVETTHDVEGIVGYKLGVVGALRLGLRGAVQAICDITDLPVVYDHQKAGPDIPDMAAKYVAICSEAGVHSLILFPLAGERAAREFASHAQREGLIPIVGGALPFAEYYVSGGGYVADDALDRIFALSVTLGVTDFVVPANDPGMVRHYAETLQAEVDRPGVFLPGIGALGGGIEDAFAAAAGCRRYAVIGREIYRSKDPRLRAQQLGEEALRWAAKSPT
jgi:orotidine-5'-phosphate decarboxylase